MRGPAVLIAGLLAAVLSCTTGGGTARLPQPARPATQPQAAPAGLQSALPAPATLREQLKGRRPAKSASYDSGALYKAAEDFEPTLPNQHVAATANGAEFSPAWDPATPSFAGLSFAIYRFEIPDYAGNSVLAHHWFWPPTDPQSVYFALANWHSNGWDFYPASADADLALPSFAPYLDASGLLLVCALRIGGDQSELQSLRIGSLPPMRSLEASPRFGFAPLTVTFDASGSVDPDGTIVEYLWDPEGDGSFDLSTGSEPTLEWEYTVPGDYQAGLRLIDNNNVYSVISLGISAVGEGPLTYGGDAGDEDIRSAVVLDDGSVMLLGYWDDLASSDNQVLVLRLTANGILHFGKLWGGSESDTVFDAVRGADGYIYACGSTSNSGNQDALLMKWSPQGELLFSLAIGGPDYRERYRALAINGDSLYVCGEFDDPALPRNYGLISRFDTSGNELWSATLISPFDCFYRDIVYYSPITFEPPVLKVCGAYQTLDNENDCVYAQYDTDGNRLSCQLWGEDGLDESGSAVDIAGNFVVQTYVAGMISDLSTSWSFLGRPGGTTVVVQDSVRLVSNSLMFPTLQLTRSVTPSSYSVVLAGFNNALELQSQTEFGAAPDGSTIPRVLGYYAGGQLIAGMQWAETPVESSVAVTVLPSAEAWEDVSPPQGAPSLDVTPLQTSTADVSDMDFNRGANKWDALVYLNH